MTQRGNPRLEPICNRVPKRKKKYRRYYVVIWEKFPELKENVRLQIQRTCQGLDKIKNTAR